MGIYSVGGRSAATAATFDHGAAILWNPHSTKRIWIIGFEWCMTDGTAAVMNWKRVTTRGTPGSTITPDIDNSWDQDMAPPSGALLDLAAYSVQPTADASVIVRIRSGGVTATGGMWPFADAESKLCVPPGTGFGALTQTTSLIPVVDFTFIWEERD